MTKAPAATTVSAEEAEQQRRGLMLVLSVFLMVPVASAITSMFLDEVAAAVEARHYPHLPPVPGVPFYDSVKDTLNFLGVIIGAIAGVAAGGLAELRWGDEPPATGRRPSTPRVEESP